MNTNIFRLFSTNSIETLFSANTEEAFKSFDRVKDFLKVDADELSEDIANKNMIIVPQINSLERKAFPPTMEDILNGAISPSTNMPFQVAVIRYKIPYSGNEELFTMKPLNSSSQTYNGYFTEGFINFKIFTDYAQPIIPEDIIKDVKNRANTITDWIIESLELLNQDCTTYNSKLKAKLKKEILSQQSKSQILKDLTDKLN